MNTGHRNLDPGNCVFFSFFSFFLQISMILPPEHLLLVFIDQQTTCFEYLFIILLKTKKNMSFVNKKQILVCSKKSNFCPPACLNPKQTKICIILPKIKVFTESLGTGDSAWLSPFLCVCLSVPPLLGMFKSADQDLRI